jgi:triacylglycerol esterase/lipase EstA (alpha/beta hydrolase family)
LGEKNNPKQAAEIETLQKQLAIQKDKAAKLKVLHEAQRIAEPDKNLVLSRPSSATRDAPVTTRDVPGGPRDVTGNQTVMGAWLENKKWSKKVMFKLKCIVFVGTLRLFVELN